MSWKKAEIEARWDAHLYCDCPNCKERVDLMEADDFWEGRTIEIAEHGTEESDALDVKCPACGHQFEVCCEW